MKNRHTSVVLSGALLLLGVSLAAYAQRPGAKPVRALPPEKWDPLVTDIFFDNANEKLSGERPNFSNIAASTPNTGGAATTGGGPAESAGGVFDWSNLVAPEVIADEIKALNFKVDETVSTPARFKSGGYQDARLHFTMLATLFAIAAEHDGDVRFQEQAPALRDLFARAGMNSKVGSTAAFNEAKVRKQDLADLIRGETVATDGDAEVAASWGEVADRPPLMQRMEESLNKRLLPWLSSNGEFNNHIEEVYHESQVLAALAEVITREGFEYWDDETYLEYAHALRDASKEITEAVKLNSYDKARAAVGNAAQACTECHEGYRA